jgi:hypothetical protein
MQSEGNAHGQDSLMISEGFFCPDGIWKSGCEKECSEGESLVPALLL